MLYHILKWLRIYHVKNVNSNMYHIGYLTYLGNIKYYRTPSVLQISFFFEKAHLGGTDTLSEDHAIAWKVLLVSKYVCVCACVKFSEGEWFEKICT